MTALHAIMAVLSAWRLTECLTQDRITDFIRRRPNVHYFWTCMRCVSVWAGVISTALFYFAPFVNWPFAMSQALLVYVSFRQHAGQRKIVVMPDSRRIDWGEYGPDEGKRIMREAFAVEPVGRNGGR